MFEGFEFLMPDALDADTSDAFWGALEAIGAEKMATFTADQNMTALMQDFMVQYKRYPVQFEQLNTTLMSLIEGILV